jgi:hypothetical protein
VKITRAVLNSVRLLDTLALILSEIEADDLVPKPSPAMFCGAARCHWAHARCTSGEVRVALKNARFINANCGTQSIH